jgi:hypothetical protein
MSDSHATAKISKALRGFYAARFFSEQWNSSHCHLSPAPCSEHALIDFDSIAVYIQSHLTQPPEKYADIGCSLGYSCHACHAAT